MKFQIKTKTLQQALDTVNHATANISTTPILENILIKVCFSSIVFTSNNLEMAIEHIVSEDIKIDTEGIYSIPSKIFTNYINLLEDDQVEIELLVDKSLEVKTSSSNIKIKGNDADDFPIIPRIDNPQKFKLKSSILKKAIEKTLFSRAEGNIRPTLAGVYINIEGKNASFATTDSFRLSEYSTILDSEIEKKFSQIIPSKTAQELRALLSNEKEVEIITGDNQISFNMGNTRFYSRLLNGKFPDYSNFFPTSYNTKIVLNRYDLISGLRRVNILSRETNYSIKMLLSNEEGISIETSQTQIGEAKIDITGSIEGEDAIIGLNSEYLLKALQVIAETHISISFESPLSPILIVGDPEDKDVPKIDKFQHIIMPLKI